MNSRFRASLREMWNHKWFPLSSNKKGTTTARWNFYEALRALKGCIWYLPSLFQQLQGMREKEMSLNSSLPGKRDLPKATADTVKRLFKIFNASHCPKDKNPSHLQIWLQPLLFAISCPFLCVFSQSHSTQAETSAFHKHAELWELLWTRGERHNQQRKWQVQRPRGWQESSRRGALKRLQTLLQGKPWLAHLARALARVT